MHQPPATQRTTAADSTELAAVHATVATVNSSSFGAKLRVDRAKRLRTRGPGHHVVDGLLSVLTGIHNSNSSCV